MSAATNRRQLLRGALGAGAAVTVAAVPAMSAADAASVQWLRQRYCRPGAMERGLKILSQGPAAGGPPDPVFALVDAHKVAWARFLETEGCTDHETVEAAGRAVDAALAEIMKTPPTTRAGARAVIEHLIDWDEDGAMETGRYLATLLRSPVLTSV